MATLKQLEKKSKSLWAELDKVIDEIRDQKTKAQRPALLKKYVGKYFNYKNGDSSGQKWYIYYKVLGIKDLAHASVFSLETMQNEYDDGWNVRIELDNWCSFDMFEEEISATEFNQAYQGLIEQIKVP